MKVKATSDQLIDDIEKLAKAAKKPKKPAKKKEADMSDGMIDDIVGDICSQLKDEGAAQTVDSDVNLGEAIDYVSTTIPALDGRIGRPGLPVGRVIEAYGPPDSGKCLKKGTQVLMHDGTVKLVEDIIAGDKIMGPDSTPREVLSICRGREKMYSVIPNYGEEWGCNASHILSLVCNYAVTSKFVKGAVYNLSINEFLDLPEHVRAKLKLYRTGVEFQPSATQYDPYWVGLWLGDGTTGATHITKDEPELEPFFEDFADRHELIYRKRINKERTSTYVFTKYEVSGGKANPLLDFVRTLVVNDEKRIPQNYLVNSRENRLQLLAGLLDTDGYYNRAGFEIVTKYDGLARDILFLCRSLGLRATCAKTIKSIKETGFVGEYNRIYISGGCHEIPTLLSRKQAEVRRDQRNHLVTGFELRDDGEGEYFGFTLSGDRLFLLGDFTVAHNTTLATHVMIETQRRGGIAILADTEKKFYLERAAAMGLDVKRVIMLRATTIEELFAKVEAAVKAVRKRAADRIVTIVWDSLGGTPTKAELKGKSDDEHMATAARVTKKNLRRTVQMIHDQKIMFLVLNHSIAKIGVMFGEKSTSAGGDGIKFYSTVRLKFIPIGKIKEDDDVVGRRVIIETAKNHLARPNQSVELEIRDLGMTAHDAFIADALKAGVLQRGSAKGKKAEKPEAEDGEQKAGGSQSYRLSDGTVLKGKRGVREWYDALPSEQRRHMLGLVYPQTIGRYLQRTGK